MSTTQISLIRLHTEKIRPPRALWVPFDLGRPLGVPNNPAFQKQVLVAALKLLEVAEGPVLADFPQDAPASPQEPTVLACPYIPPGEEVAVTEKEKLCRNFQTEIMSMRPWYDLAVEKRKRSTVGLSKLSPDEIGNFICSFITGSSPENPRKDMSLANELRFAADDLKAYYFEAVTSQPGMGMLDANTLARWFWEDTVAGKALLAIRDVCAESKDESLQRVGRGQIVPSKFSSLKAK